MQRSLSASSSPLMVVKVLGVSSASRAGTMARTRNLHDACQKKVLKRWFVVPPQGDRRDHHQYLTQGDQGQKGLVQL